MIGGFLMKRLKKKSNIDKNIPLENKLKQLNDIGQHKTYILTCSTALANYLMENNREQDDVYCYLYEDLYSILFLQIHC